MDRGSATGPPAGSPDVRRLAVPTLSESARAFLTERRVAHLATADRAGIPHVVPLCFALGDSEVLYFVIDAKPKRHAGTALKRMRNIAENPRVSIVADEYGEDWTRLAYVLVHGTASVVTDAAERDTALALLRAKYPQYRAMDLDGPSHPVVRVAIEHAHHWRSGR